MEKTQTLKEVMEFERMLPEDWDGTFRFTNNSKEDFVAKWASKEYVFPAMTTSPMPAASLNATPLEIQQIRKKFALDWAQREYGKTDAYKGYLAQEKNSDGTPKLNSIHQAGSYGPDQLVALIQMCLKPLVTSRATVQDALKEPIENKLSRDDEGELNTIVVKPGGDLIEEKKSLKRKAAL